MDDLNLPAFNYRVKEIEGKLHIFDILRKKFLFLTPEEWVRQHVVHFLIEDYNYPKSLIRCEGGLDYNGLQKRSDILVHDRKGKPFLLVECKAAAVKMSQAVFEQVAIYNKTIEAPYIAITNGLKTFVCAIDQNTSKYTYLQDFPKF